MRPRLLLATSCCAAALIAGACSSSSSDDAATTLSFGTLADTPSGDTCTDATGDLMVDESDEGQRRAEPAGIDITSASAELGDDELTLRFETVQPIASAPEPLFLVQHGDLIQSPSLSWEIRVELEGGAWTATLITVPNVGRQIETTLNHPVQVTGNTLTLVLPRSDLPSISSRLWSFGSSAGVSANNSVFDDCLPFDQTSTDGGTTGSTTDGGSASMAPIVGQVGSAIEGPDGSSVTVHAVEAPAVPDEGVALDAVPGTQLVAADVEVCATDRPLQAVGDARFVVTMSNGDVRDVVSLPTSPHQPQFPVEITLRPGSCERGWVTFQVAADTSVASVAYDVSGVGVGPLLVAET